MAVCLSACDVLWAQAGYRIYQEQLRVELDSQNPVDRELGFDAGGWFNFALFSYNDPASRTNRTLNEFQLGGWADFNYKNIHKFYFRGVLNWDLWAPGDNPHDRHGADFDEIVERAWYQVDIDRLFGSQPDEENFFDLGFKVGREYVTIGTAFTLAMPLDMMEWDVRAGDLGFRAILGETIKDQLNIDTSEAVATHQRRCMYGFELSYLGLPQHRPFVYYWAQQDHSNPEGGKITTQYQNYDYSSRYIGVGSEGTIFLPRLNYSAEFVGEMGKAYSNTQFDDNGNIVAYGKDDICAFGLDLQLMYAFEAAMNPRVKFEYMWGSGDSDRGGNSSSTFGGNRPGTKDNAFNAFGYRDTGIAFAPEVSNIHIWLLNGAFNPFDKCENQLLKRMEVGSTVYFYARDKANGPISDWNAKPEGSRWLGCEWDVYCNWRITSDLAWSIRYGLFLPNSGSFYSETDQAKHFLYTGVTFSF